MKFLSVKTRGCYAYLALGFIWLKYIREKCRGMSFVVLNNLSYYTNSVVTCKVRSFVWLVKYRILQWTGTSIDVHIEFLEGKRTGNF